MTCQIEEREAGRPYPRTCQDCGFGPCKNRLKIPLPDAHGTKPVAQGYGWVCPNCHTAYAPHVQSCRCAALNKAVDVRFHAGPKGTDQ